MKRIIAAIAIIASLATQVQANDAYNHAMLQEQRRTNRLLEEQNQVQVQRSVPYNPGTSIGNIANDLADKINREREEKRRQHEHIQKNY